MLKISANATNSAMGIIFPNIYDEFVPELVSDRLMASIPFASRYRMIDFTLSNMVNSGIDNIAILVRKNYFSLLDHLGSGREWDLSRKNGGINIFPPYSQNTVGVYEGRIEALQSILAFLKEQKEKYVVMSNANLAANINLKEIIAEHIRSQADVTVVYKKEPIPKSILEAKDTSKNMCYTLELDDEGRVTQMHINSQEPGIQNFSMNIYIIERELLIKHVQEAFLFGGRYLERDVLIPKMKELKIVGYEFTGYTARVESLKEYFDENMRLLDDDNLDALFSESPIYTKIRDDNPTRYLGDARAENVMVADGCIIEGEVENSVLFRGVKIGKGAKVKNCILMQDTVVEAGANLEYIITDKVVTVTEDKVLKGNEEFPVYVPKWKVV
jgi:glucose-1-phosphate adenylyltransferase